MTKLEIAFYVALGVLSCASAIALALYVNSLFAQRAMDDRLKNCICECGSDLTIKGGP